MKVARIGTVALMVLGGCQANLTLEEAQALCMKKGGLLTVIYTQRITASGIGDPVGTPGECVSPKEFDVDTAAPRNAPAPTK